MDIKMPKSQTSRKPQPLSSLDNNSVSHRLFPLQENEFTPKDNQHKNQQYLFLDDRLQKENRPPPGLHQQAQRTPSHSNYHHAGYPVNRSIGSNNIRKATPRHTEHTRQHPSTGGKTISSSLMKKVSQSCRGNSGGSNDENNSNSGNHINRSNSPHLRIKPKQRIEQRMSPEQLKLLCRRIDPSLPASAHGSPSKPILPSIFTNDANNDRPNSSLHHSSRPAYTSTSSLYQTCIDLWPSEPTLGNFASDNIKNLTNLLKVRLSQAKYRVLAQLEEDDHKHTNPTLLSAARILRDDIDYSTWPSFEKHTIELSTKRSCGYVNVSGNGVRLFRQRNLYLQSRRLQQKQQHQQHLGLVSSPLIGKTTAMDIHGHRSEIRATVSLPPPSPSSHLKTGSKRKRRVNSKANEKLPRNDGRDLASKTLPVEFEDGSRAFVCTPCNKKYKTRNGLAYHLDRCANQPVNETAYAPITNDEQTITTRQHPSSNSSSSLSPGSKSSGVHCVCDHPTDDEEMMVQCDECQLWLHLDCVGTNDGVLDDIYHCPRCTGTKRPRLTVSEDQQQQQQQQQAMNSLIFQQLNDTTALPMEASTKQLPFHSQASSTQPSLWDNFDLLDGSDAVTPSAPIPTPSSSNTSNHGDTANMWGLSTVDIPSLLYSDANGLPSALDDDYLPSIMDLPSSELSPHDLPPTDWFQFANFDDDFHCDNSQPTTQ
ncbi:hypothetical protein BCR42DRAFT_485717 [Absidia repens]|uniref:PHD-type domain-containing protein n=1 Tax=Absidia repens TaxID=90262 RepID=A0A1X2J172_9FUNG|nr:hypothetical protein BCR42DRAFT_485717 [Absidia repens]